MAEKAEMQSAQELFDKIGRTMPEPLTRRHRERMASLNGRTPQHRPATAR